MRWLMLLSGGAARGAAQVPVIEGLIERLGPPSAVAGTSIGAGNGALVAAGRHHRLRELWTSVESQADFQARRVDGWRGHYSLNRFRRLLERSGATETAMPCHVGIVDLASGRHQLVPLLPLTPEERLDAIVASASEPFVHRRAQFRGRWVVDGGVLHPVPPYSAWRTFKQIHVVLCQPTSGAIGATEHVVSAAEQAGRVADLLMSRLVRLDVARLRRWAGDGARVWVYAPPSFGAIGPSYDATKERIASRLELGRQMLEEGARLA